MGLENLRSIKNSTISADSIETNRETTLEISHVSFYSVCTKVPFSQFFSGRKMKKAFHIVCSLNASKTNSDTFSLPPLIHPDSYQ
jgi:hypothetical protein